MAIFTTEELDNLGNLVSSESSEARLLGYHILLGNCLLIPQFRYNLLANWIVERNHQDAFVKTLLTQVIPLSVLENWQTSTYYKTVNVSRLKKMLQKMTDWTWDWQRLTDEIIFRDSSFGHDLAVYKIMRGLPIAQKARERITRLSITQKEGTLVRLFTFDFSSLPNLQFLAIANLGLCTNFELRVGEKLSKLTHLEIYNNSLGELHNDFFSKFPCLERLELQNNNLVRLPQSIGDLPCLEYLDVAGNYLKDLPTSFKKLHRLHHLYIAENCFRKTPLVLRTLPCLNELTMYDQKNVSTLDTLQVGELAMHMREGLEAKNEDGDWEEPNFKLYDSDMFEQRTYDFINLQNMLEEAPRFGDDSHLAEWYNALPTFRSSKRLWYEDMLSFGLVINVFFNEF